MDDLYGLFFVSIIVLLLVLVVNFLLVNYNNSYELFWNTRDLENKAQYWAGRIINVNNSIPESVLFVDLEYGQKYNSTPFVFNHSFSYPVLLMVNNEYHAGRVMVGE